MKKITKKYTDHEADIIEENLCNQSWGTVWHVDNKLTDTCILYIGTFFKGHILNQVEPETQHNTRSAFKCLKV